MEQLVLFLEVNMKIPILCGILHFVEEAVSWEAAAEKKK